VSSLSDIEAAIQLRMWENELARRSVAGDVLQGVLDEPEELD
jgi:hypothetical protein